MSSFMETLTPDPVYGSNVNFDEQGNPIRPVLVDHLLTSEEEICFNCPLADCVEEGKEGCIIELRAMQKKASNYEKQVRSGTISRAGKKKLSTINKQLLVGFEKFHQGVAIKINAVYTV